MGAVLFLLFKPSTRIKINTTYPVQNNKLFNQMSSNNNISNDDECSINNTNTNTTSINEMEPLSQTAKYYINIYSSNNAKLSVSATGQLFGWQGFNDMQGELVFQTAMTGYPETFTDPSYIGQFLVMTYPLIGNYGWPDTEYLECHNGCAPNAIITSEMYDFAMADHPNSLLNLQQSQKSLIQQSGYLMPLILWGADTRALTEFIRENGDSQCMITTDSNKWPELSLNPVKDACVRQDYLFNPELLPLPARAPYSRPDILFINLGAKVSQYRVLSKFANLTCVLERDLPKLLIDDIIKKYSGIFISNGPGDPRDYSRTINFIRTILKNPYVGSVRNPIRISIFGICLGHQVLALAHDISVSKLKYGHRGINIPAVLMDDIGKQQTQFGILTSQNHGYEVQLPVTPSNANHSYAKKLFTNANDDSCEGLWYPGTRIFSVQFHPEACPGPLDSQFLFRAFELSVANTWKEQLGIQTSKEPIGNQIYDLVLGELKLARQYNPNSTHKLNINSMGPISSQKRKIMILGSGGIQIGQAGEFDYSGAQAVKSFRAAGFETILVNPNIATYQTSLADKVYYLPITPHFVRQIINAENPEFITVSFGGQTALNTGLALQEYLAEKGVTVLGTPLKSIQISEDRNLFKEHLLGLSTGQIHSAPSRVIHATAEEALKTAASLGGYPLLIRAGFCLGGAGSGFVYSDAELVDRVEKVAAGGASEVILDKDLRGWKELELEIMRDQYGNKLCICGMENLDPLGVHTGESIVTAPCQTIPDAEYQEMRTMAFNIVDSLGIVGECNVQFAINPVLARPTRESGIFVIEMNARLSRSSALASKATGYPIAAVAAQIQLGKSLTEIRNKATADQTSAFFEPSLDYVVVKIPRWDLNKAPGVMQELGTAMKSVGEVMGIGRSFKEALVKAMRMVGMPTLIPINLAKFPTSDLSKATPDRLINLFKWLWHSGHEIQTLPPSEANKEILAATGGITPWFIWQLMEIVNFCKTCYLTQQSNTDSADSPVQQTQLIHKGKQLGLSDDDLTTWLGISSSEIQTIRHENDIRPRICVIDTVAGEFPCATNYFYLSYHPHKQSTLTGFKKPLIVPNNTCPSPCKNGTANIKGSGKERVIILGSGVYRIGSSVEFDWCAVSAANTARTLGYETIMVNHNPETVSTDYDEVDYLFFDELTAETVAEIYHAANNQISSEVAGCRPCRGVIVSMGGQAANNIVMRLAELGVPILGTPAEMIDTAENRYKFSRLCDAIEVRQPRWTQVTSYADLARFCESAYPVIIRPSYVLSGTGMVVVRTRSELDEYIRLGGVDINAKYPVVASVLIESAKEIEVDAIAAGGQIKIMAISEHVENAGVHSGDATLVLPAQDLTTKTINQIKQIAALIATNLNITGPFNIQLIAKADEIMVIECNLRASRSFPFASRTLGINFIDLAVRAILEHGSSDANRFDNTSINKSSERDMVVYSRVGVKVPMFSFSRLGGSRVALGVEMQSTGEVAAFGANRNIAFLKAMMATPGFRMPPERDARIVIISRSQVLDESADDKSDNRQLQMIRKMVEDMGWYLEQELGQITADTIKKSHLVVVLGLEQSVVASEHLNCPYSRIARQAIDYNIPLVINTKLAKLLVESIYYYYRQSLALDPILDCYINYSAQPVATTAATSIPVIANNRECISYQPEYRPSPTRTEIVFTDKHILSATQFNRNLLRQIFRRASELKYACRRGGVTGLPKPLAGKVIGLLFYTPSTRTRCSFESAIKRLGGETILVAAGESSVMKGESLADTIRTLETYCDGLVIRTENSVSLPAYSHLARHRMINAGDFDEHPTQCLLDLFTIRETRGTINGLTILITGDLANGRTAQSLVKVLCNYDCRIICAAPSSDFQLPTAVREYFSTVTQQGWAKGNRLTIEFITTVNEWQLALKEADVVYMTRIQTERIIPSNYNLPTEPISQLILTRELAETMKADAIILHPLPRNAELPTELDNNPRAMYFKQMEYGLYLRMAIAELMWGA
jgi:carbamoyl-phosphate synthase/aspartate carbamoyltransferase